MKILTSKTHGIIDYLVVVFLLLSPTIFGLSEPVATLTYCLGGVHLMLTALTKFQYGLIKVIPFQLHGRIELVVSIILIASPLLFGSYVNPENLIDKFFLAGFGMAVFITWVITDYSNQ